MPAMRVVPALNEIEDRERSLAVRLELMKREQLAFKGCVELSHIALS